MMAKSKADIRRQRKWDREQQQAKLEVEKIKAYFSRLDNDFIKIQRIIRNGLCLLLVLVTIHYTVAAGDTLQSIAEQYCPGTDSRQVAEFREGIRELNYSVIGDGEVWKGLTLQINVWKDDGNGND